jgi:2-dehydro-3-deoxygluconokinase
MKYGLNIRQDGALDLVSVGALVHRLDPGIIPFRKATTCQIHVSGGEYNVAANLANCFGLRTGIATAMVDQHRHRLQRPWPGRARAGGFLQPL